MEMPRQLSSYSVIGHPCHGLLVEFLFPLQLLFFIRLFFLLGAGVGWFIL
jgi:hypothetical protein